MNQPDSMAPSIVTVGGDSLSSSAAVAVRLRSAAITVARVALRVDPVVDHDCATRGLEGRSFRNRSRTTVAGDVGHQGRWRLISIALLGFSLLSLLRHPKFRAAFAYLVPLWLFAAWGGVSVLWSASKSTSLTQVATLVMLIMLSTLLAIVWRSDRDTERVIRQLTFTFLGISVCLLLLHFGLPRSGSLTKNSSGIFHSTNAGATASLAILLIVVARLLWDVAWTKLWLIPVILVQLTVLLIAGNRLSIMMVTVTISLALSRVRESREVGGRRVGEL